MKRSRSMAALLAISASLGLAVSPAVADELVSPVLPGFVVGFEASNDQQSIREEVPAGESVEDWTRMVTTQRFTRAATRLTPAGFLEMMARNMAAACPGARTSPAVMGSLSGNATARFRADCPLLAQTGKPETFFMLVVSDGKDLHVKQVAFRREPTAADVQWADGLLASVTIRP
jgi:hypothetical protein